MSKKKILTAETTLKIRFSEVDSMGVVWHGSYVKYLEDAREAFGAQHGLSYLFVFDNGFLHHWYHWTFCTKLLWYMAMK